MPGGIYPVGPGVTLLLLPSLSYLVSPSEQIALPIRSNSDGRVG